VNITITAAKLIYVKKEGYSGYVHFEAEGHKAAYELTLIGKKSSEWSYSLNFLNGPGVEEEINAVEQEIEENDELFDSLIDAAMETVVRETQEEEV